VIAHTQWSERRVQVALALVAIAIYLPGIVWGLPFATGADRIGPWGSDELAPLGGLAQVYTVIVHGSAMHDPRYPLLPYLIQAVAVAPYLLWLKLTGGVETFTTQYPYGLTDPVGALRTMTMIARLTSLAMATAVVLVAYHTGRYLWDRRTGIVAATFVMLLYLLVYYARTSNGDAGMLLWTALGMFVFAKVLTEGLTARHAALLGVFAALATATKDQSYALFAVIAAVVGVRHLAAGLRNRTPIGALLREPLIGLAVSLAVYAVVSGLVFNLELFGEHVRFVVRDDSALILKPDNYYSTPATLAGYVSLAGRSALYLVDIMSWPIALLAVAGLILAGIRDPRHLWWALPVLGVLIGVIFPVRFARMRFMLTSAYVLTIYAAYAAAVIVRPREARAPAAAGMSFRTIAGRALVTASVAWALLRAGDLTYQMLRDGRYDAGAWLAAHTREGDALGFYDSPAKLPRVPAFVRLVPAPYNVALPSAPTEPPEYIVLVPQQPFEIDHEWNLPAERYRELVSGDAGYELVLEAQTPSLFGERVISFVNPRTQIFARSDVADRRRVAGAMSNGTIDDRR
jgi:hypothetical protein